MSELIEYSLNKASEAEIVAHLRTCDADFVPPLSGRVEIGDYAKKIASKATRFEAWSGDTLISLVAAYCNDQESRIAFITSVSVLRAWTGKGIVARLMNECVGYAKSSGMPHIRLEVAIGNAPAIKLYEKRGFIADKMNASFVTMSLDLSGKEDYEQKT